MWESPGSSLPHTKSFRKLRNTESRRSSFLIVYSISNGQPEDIHVSNIIQIEQTVYVFINRYVITYKYIYVTTISIKIGHEFEKQKGGMYGKVFKKKQEWKKISQK